MPVPTVCIGALPPIGVPRPDRLPALDLVDVGHVESFRDGQVDRLTGFRRQVLHVRRCQFAQVEIVDNGTADLPCLESRRILLVFGGPDVIQCGQRLQQAKHRRLGQFEFAREFRHALRAFRCAECLQNSQAL